MNILYAFDDKYAELAGVSLVSLFENNKDAEELNVYAVCGGVSEINKQRLVKIQNDYSRKIMFADAPDVEKIVGRQIEIEHKQWSLAAFNRLFISSILPQDMKKIIYLDCDTIIRGSLAKLWAINQDNNIVSGVRGINTIWQNLFNKRIFLKRNDIYISSGVMLINLDLWRHYNVEEKFIKFIKLMDGKIPSVDQGVINSVLKGYIGALDPEYNYPVTEMKKFSHSKDKKRVFKIQRHNNPTVVHYIDIWGKLHKYKSAFNIALRDDWYKWRDASPWHGLPLEHLRVKVPSQLPPIPKKTENKTLKGALLSFFERNCKPVFILLNKLGSYRKAFLKFFTESARIRKHNKHRQKVTGINIKDCRIGKRT
ncbi:MAG: glycosyltransferase family 8 protein [Oscillospiraceae bacterium]|nr:glycosyltransferase family 8 protein [Oscillospiraceae bacterium]